MPYQPVPIALKQGLSTTTPPLMAEPGTLIDCLNYEMVTDVGYKRIDGFESYDGWANGNVSDYYTVPVNITDGTITATLVAGATLFQTAVGVKSVALGTVLNYAAGVLTYLPALKGYPIIPSGTGLDTTYYATGGTARMSTTAAAQSGLNTDTAANFVANCRSYGTTLRNLVSSFATPVAGVHWLRNNLVVALDCPFFTYNDTTTNNAVQEGYQVSYLGTLYRVVNRAYSSPKMTLHVEPIGTSVNNTTTLKVEGWSSTIATLSGASSVVLNTSSSSYAYFVAANNIQSATARGSTVLNRSVIVQFTGGVAAAQNSFTTPGSLVSIGTGAAQYNGCYVKNCVVTSGTFAANTAAGYLEVIPHSSLGFSGNINYIDATMNIYNLSGTTQWATGNVGVIRSKAAGTAQLIADGTRYQWITSNFFGQDGTIEAYGCTGSSRGFWLHAYTPPLTRSSNPESPISADVVNDFSWGSIVTDLVATSLDKPRYVAYHGGRLALGFSGGSVELSVPGQPRNFSGLGGADEIAVGDHVTGILEAVGDSLMIFGRRSIHRLVGIASASLQLQTISGNSGAFDYTCVLVGSTPVFTGPQGITTLDQSQAYGDFVGERLSSSVDVTLNPLLVADNTKTQLGGAVMAMPVRGKNQYRLWLSTGDVYTVTMVKDGAKVMKSNYGLSTDIRVPFAWTSELGDAGMERIFVVWDKDRASKSITLNGAASTLPDPARVYQMDSGWGFDGKTFTHYIELAHIFSPTQEQYTSIGKVRLMGYGFGLATLDIKTAGIENDFNQAYHTAIQDLSMPASLTTFSRNMQPVMAVVDQASWGLGVKMKIQGSLQENLTTTEPSFVCQVLVIYLNTEGVTTQ